MKKVWIILLVLLGVCLADPITITTGKAVYNYKEKITATIIVSDLSEYSGNDISKMKVYLLDERAEKYGEKIIALNKISPLNEKKHFKNHDLSRVFKITFDLDELNLSLGKYTLKAEIGDVISAEQALEVVNYQVGSLVVKNNLENKVILNDVAVLLNTDKVNYFYKQDKLKMTLTVQNLSKEKTKRLNFSSGQKYNFILYNKDGKTIVWEWQKGKIFTQAFWTQDLTPGQKIIYAEAINLADLNLALGEYILEANFKGLSLSVKPRTKIRIRN